MTKNNGKRKTVIVHEGKHIRFLKKGGWEMVQRNNCTGVVVILAITKNRKVILTEQYRVPVQKNVIEFPAGLVNHNVTKRESFITAAKRELFEETGYRAKRMVKVMEGPISGGLTSDTLTIMKAIGLTKEGQGGGDELEEITVHEIPINAVDTWLGKKQRQGRLVDPKIYAGLYLLKKGLKA